MKSKLLTILPVFLFVSILTVGWIHRFWLFDTYRILVFDPDPRISQLVDRSGMSSEGERLFLAAQPELLLEDEFDAQCQFAELGLVLGCYRSANIYILDVTEDQLEPVEPVTAGHEMLHVVYSRMNDDEIELIHELLDEQFELVENQRVLEEIEGYKNDPDADLYNEMHSIFATELVELTPELEAHYARYFEDRSLVLAESAAYEEVFIKLEAQIEGYDAELARIGQEIDALEAEVQDLNQEIVNERARLESLLANNQVNEYNAAVPGFNALVNLHNARVESVKAKIIEYNDIVAERNENVAAKNNLIKSLDSSVETIE